MEQSCTFVDIEAAVELGINPWEERNRKKQFMYLFGSAERGYSSNGGKEEHILQSELHIMLNECKLSACPLSGRTYTIVEQ